MKMSAKKMLSRCVCTLAVILGVQMASAEGESYLLWEFDDPEITSLSGETVYVDELSAGARRRTAFV